MTVQPMIVSKGCQRKQHPLLVHGPVLVGIQQWIVKNRYKTLRRQYNLIKSLLQSDGFVWDETCQIVFADDCVWKDYLKVRINIRNLLGN